MILFLFVSGYIKNETPIGGETGITDGFKVADVLKKEDPRGFDLLTKVWLPHIQDISYEANPSKLEYRINAGVRIIIVSRNFLILSLRGHQLWPFWQF